jgi:hypothetical protein
MGPKIGSGMANRGTGGAEITELAQELVPPATSDQKG